MSTGLIMGIAFGAVTVLILTVFAVGLVCERVSDRRRVLAIHTEVSAFLTREHLTQRTSAAADPRRLLPPVCALPPPLAR